LRRKRSRRPRKMRRSGRRLSKTKRPVSFRNRRRP